MGFDSLGYVIFLYAVLCLFWLWRPSVSVLLGASLFFYATFDWRHLLLLLGVSALTFAGGRLVEKNRSTWLLASLLALVFFPLLAFKLARGSVAFPLGISFFTFHCASYLIDISRGVVAAEKAPSRLFLYVSFFPQLVAGPITRAAEILPQLSAPSQPDGPAIRRSLWRIYLGFLKKLAIANVIGLYARLVFEAPGLYHGVVVASAVLAGRYFVYADFSGYTDIAIGSARLLGIKLPENFLRPFAAPSIAEYWRRWHITLSCWIRDYLFFPLASTRLSIFGTYPILLLTFLTLGLWHGFTLNFVLYGLWHGSFLVLHDLTRTAREKLWKALGMNGGFATRWIFPWATFLLIVCPPTILFLSTDLAAAGRVARGLVSGSGGFAVSGIAWFRLASALLTIAGLEVYQWAAVRQDTFTWLECRSRGVRVLAYVLAGGWLAFAAFGGENMEFLYFGF